MKRPEKPEWEQNYSSGFCVLVRKFREISNICRLLKAHGLMILSPLTLVGKTKYTG